MSEIRCPHCSKLNPEGTRYCQQCGINLGDAAPKDSRGRPRYGTAHFLARPAQRPRRFDGWRYDLLADLHGRVLELGIRRGPNFRFYPPDVKVVATDVDPVTMQGARNLFPHFAQGIALS